MPISYDRKNKFYLENSFFSKIIVVIIAVSTITAIGGPILKFDKLTIDLGEISETNTPDVIFPFQNVGDGELIVDQLGGSCPCQKLRVTKTNLSPGQKGELIAKLISSNKSGPATDTLTVHSNDAHTPLTILEINRFVKKEVQVIPEAIIFDSSSGIKEKKLKVLGPTADTAFSVKSIDVNGLPIETDIQPSNDTGDLRRKWDITLRLKDINLPTMNSASLTLVTSSQFKHRIQLPITVVNRATLRATPSSLTWIINDHNAINREKTVSLVYYLDQRHKDKQIKSPTYDAPNYFQIRLLNCETTHNYAKWTFSLCFKDGKLLRTQADQIKFTIESEKTYLIFPVAVVNLICDNSH